ncbi:MAG TPA: DUF1801 domain-containing protein [Myxococcaceae bacterium]|nr:DUF1801 domain-containing protein [Myxococcaceae bacterium]
MRSKVTSVDEYLAGVSSEHRAALERLRRTIRSVAPKVEESISYGVPTFRLDGRGLVAFGTASGHCSLFPLGGTLIEKFADELADFDTSKGTIRFQPDRPLPAALVKKLVKARIAENKHAVGKRR